MRIPVFARGANPRFDRPFLKKSKSYTDGEVAAGRADYLDPNDPAKGILCRGSLYFGPPRIESAAPETTDFDGAWRLDGELRGVKFVPPTNDPRLAILARVRQGWDWSQERASA